MTKENSLVTVPKKNWEDGRKALGTITDLKKFLKGDQEDVPNNLKSLVRRDNKGQIKVSIFCVSCGVTCKIILNTNKRNDTKKGLCPHLVFHLSEII